MAARSNYQVTIPTFHAGQVDIWNKRGKRNLVRCGRRFGKTKMIVALSTDSVVKGRQAGIFAPEYKQLQEPYDEILRTLGDTVSASNKSDGVIKTVTDGKLDFWRLIDNELAGRGREYDRICIDEGAYTKNGQMTDIWNKSIVPTMATKPRADVWLYSTPKGVDSDNFFYQAAHDESMGFTCHHAPSWVNPLVDPEWIEAEQKRLHPDVWRQEILAEWVDWSGIAFFSLEKMLRDEAPVGFPSRCDCVFAVIDSAMKTGTQNDGTAVIYCARDIHGINKLMVLDWDVIQIEGSLLETWLPNVLLNLEIYARECGARAGSLGAWIEDKSGGEVLIQQAARRNLPARAIDSRLTAMGKDERALSVSGYHYQGMIKMTDRAYNKVVTFKGQTRNHLISQVTGYRMADKDAAKRADDLLDTYCYSAALALGDEYGF